VTHPQERQLYAYWDGAGRGWRFRTVRRTNRLFLYGRPAAKHLAIGFDTVLRYDWDGLNNRLSATCGRVILQSACLLYFFFSPSPCLIVMGATVWGSR